MNNLIPTPIINSLGVATTVHKRADNTAKSTERIGGVKLAAPQPESRDIPSYTFTPALDEINKNSDYFDVRDVAGALSDYSDEIVNHLEELGLDGHEDDTAHLQSEVIFNDEDLEDFEDFKKEISQWGKRMNSLNGVDELDGQPSDNNVYDWAMYGQKVSKSWEEWQNENGVTFTSEDHLGEYALDLAADSGWISRDVPTVISDNINWDNVGLDMFGENPSLDFDGTTFYSN